MKIKKVFSFGSRVAVLIWISAHGTRKDLQHRNDNDSSKQKCSTEVLFEIKIVTNNYTITKLKHKIEIDLTL